MNRKDLSLSISLTPGSKIPREESFLSSYSSLGRQALALPRKSLLMFWAKWSRWSKVQFICVLFFFFFNKFSLALCCFFFFSLINLFYFWLLWVFVAMRGLSQVAVSGGYSSLWCVGFSLQWLLLLQSTGSRRAGFSSCGSWALEHRLGIGGSWT